MDGAEFTPIETPKLAEPGAGLPRIELMLGRVLFRKRRRRTSREGFEKMFEDERANIGELAESRLDSQLSSPVLIERIRGLEDSSRYWSVFMTLEHLGIVNSGITNAIHLLSRGKVPTRESSTSDVKPSAEAGAGSRELFERSCDDFLTRSRAVEKLATEKRYRHPWFGPLDAAGWHALAATHMRIHRIQIERILAGLESKPGAAGV